MQPPPASILVVDDDRDTCRNLSDILTDLGYKVQTAHDGLAALDLIRMSAFDVALLDFKLPGMNGLALYREIKRVSPATLAIMISAYLSSATTDEAHRAGTWKVLSKPLDVTQLLPLVEEAVSRPLVLLVDDDRDLCASLWDLLHERGYRVSLAHTVQVGKDLVAQRKYNVVLLDLKLPDGSARDVLAAVRDANPGARTIIITGYRQELESLIGDVLSDATDAICYKPFDLNELLAKLGRLAYEKRNRAS